MAAEHAAGATSGARPGAHPRTGRRLPGTLASARLQGRFLASVAQELARAPASGSLDDLARHRNTLVLTFRRNGKPVATPVWAALADGHAYSRIERACGKAKRIRATGRALLAPCTRQGRPLGPAVEVRARILPTAEELPAERALASRYGIGRELFERGVDLMRVDMCYAEFTPAGESR